MLSSKRSLIMTGKGQTMRQNASKDSAAVARLAPGLVGNALLLRNPRCKIGGLDAPFGIRPPPPRARTCARRINKDSIEAISELGQSDFIACVHDLNIACPGTSQAFEYRS